MKRFIVKVDVTELQNEWGNVSTGLLTNYVSFPGNAGDDFLVLGLRNGRVLHRFNLGSGVATIVSDRLNDQINVHSVTFGRSKRTGWLKVIWCLLCVVGPPQASKPASMLHISISWHSNLWNRPIQAGPKVMKIVKEIFIFLNILSKKGWMMPFFDLYVSRNVLNNEFIH